MGGHKHTKESRKKMSDYWTEERRRKRGKEARIRQKKLSAQRMALRKDNSKMTPHPDNAGTRYEAWPVAVTNIFSYLAGKWSIRTNESNDWIPVVDDGFVACKWAPGSPRKILAMRQRLEAGYPLWHPEDRVDMTPGFNDTVIGAMPIHKEGNSGPSLKSLFLKAVREIEEWEKSENLQSEQTKTT